MLRHTHSHTLAQQWIELKAERKKEMKPNQKQCLASLAQRHFVKVERQVGFQSSYLNCASLPEAFPNTLQLSTKKKQNTLGAKTS